MAITEILFRVDCDSEIGGGHLSRCIALAQRVKKKSHFPRFILYGDIKAKNILSNYGFSFIQGAARTINDQINELKKFDLQGKIVIADFINYKYLLKPNELFKLISAWQQETSLFALIDGGFNQSARKILKSLPVDVLIAPYFNEIALKNAPYLQLIGEKYFIFNNAYKQVTKKVIAKNANKILVTCGNSDPLMISECILSSLNKINVPLEIKLIEGQLFNEELKFSIHRLASLSHHQVEIIKAPKVLYREMQWSDLAISTSGLTKYELALTGTPMISISIDFEHEEVNKNFLKQGTSISLGCFDKDNTSDLIVANVLEILINYERRAKMSKTGQDLFDAHGADRVLREILNLSNL